MRKTEAELLARDAQRDIGAELLQALQDLKADRFGRKTVFTPQPDGSVLREVSTPEGGLIQRDVLTGPRWEITAARMASGLSQAQYAKAAGVSVRTLQQWEQGRSQPTGAARSLVRLLARRPELLAELDT